VTGFARLAVVLLVLACGGGNFVERPVDDADGLIVFIVSIVVFRVARWYWRRNR